MQITRSPLARRRSQKWEPRNPAPPVTTEVGIAGRMVTAQSAEPADSYGSLTGGRGGRGRYAARVPLHLGSVGPFVARIVVALALVAAALELPGAVGEAIDAVADGRPSRAERELAPGQGLGIDGDMLLRVRRVIPEEASYAIVFGDSIPLNEIQLTGIPQFLRYWLVPRRFEDERDDADWVIAYGHSSETLGIRVAEEVPLSELVNAVRVAR